MPSPDGDYTRRTYILPSPLLRSSRSELGKVRSLIKVPLFLSAKAKPLFAEGRQNLV